MIPEDVSHSIKISRLLVFLSFFVCLFFDLDSNKTWANKNSCGRIITYYCKQQGGSFPGLPRLHYLLGCSMIDQELGGGKGLGTRPSGRNMEVNLQIECN